VVSHRLVKLQRDLASTFYRRPIPVLETLNNHARLLSWIKSQKAQAFADRFALHAYVHENFVSGGAIDYLEFGVFQGESFAYWLDMEVHPDSRFYGFDTFTGLPTDWSAHFRRGHFDVEGTTPSVKDDRGQFIKGLFQETLPPFLTAFAPAGRQLVIHNDSDLYSSTLYVLASMNHLLVPGTIIIFDEFASPMHEWRAWNDYCDAFMRRATLIGYTEPYAVQAAFRID